MAKLTSKNNVTNLHELQIDKSLILGRGVDDIEDNKCSREQAKVEFDPNLIAYKITVLGKNPVVLFKKNGKVKPLQQGQSNILKHGNSFSLIPEKYVYSFTINRKNNKKRKIDEVNQDTVEIEIPLKNKKQKVKNDPQDSGKQKKQEKIQNMELDEILSDKSNSPKKPNKPRIKCKWREKCYRQNKEHLEEYCHPKDADWKYGIDSPPKKSNSANFGQIDNSKLNFKDSELVVRKNNSGQNQWQNLENSVLYFDIPSLKGSEKIASFDMDDTVITTQSGKTFATDKNDWKWLFHEVPNILKTLHQNGWKIVFFTNQAGINGGKKGYDKTKETQICSKIENIIERLKIPIQIFISIKQDKNRKPATSLWDLMVEQCNSGIKVVKAIYVGDAAGRAAEWKPGKKKDFSCSDRKFAHNIGIDFKTPEEFFLKEAKADFSWGDLDPANFANTNLDEICIGGVASLAKQHQELIIMVGFPASGKSTLVRTFLEPMGYVRVNRGEKILSS